MGLVCQYVEELLEVAVPPNLLPCHRAVNGNLVPFDVLEDAFVGRGCAANVVLGLEAIDRHDDLQPVQPLHSRGMGRTALVTSCVCMPRSAIRGKIWLSSLYLTSGSPPTIETCSGLRAIDQRHESRDQLIALVIGQPSERDVAAEMLIAVGVATRTPQRALLGDLD